MKKRIIACGLTVTILLAGCGSSEPPETTDSIETLAETTIETTVPVATAEPTIPEKPDSADIAECFMVTLAESLGLEFTDISPLDIQGDDYRTEYRLFAFENAAGKKANLNGGSIEVLSYDNSLRIYAKVETFDDASQLYEAAVRLMDPSITAEEIQSQYNDYDLDINLFLGIAGSITGYINKDYQDGGLAGYDIMIDCKHFSQ